MSLSFLRCACCFPSVDTLATQPRLAFARVMWGPETEHAHGAAASPAKVHKGSKAAAASSAGHGHGLAASAVSHPPGAMVAANYIRPLHTSGGGSNRLSATQPANPMWGAELDSDEMDLPLSAVVVQPAVGVARSDTEAAAAARSAPAHPLSTAAHLSVPASASSLQPPPPSDAASQPSSRRSSVDEGGSQGDASMGESEDGSSGDDDEDA